MYPAPTLKGQVPRGHSKIHTSNKSEEQVEKFPLSLGPPCKPNLVICHTRCDPTLKLYKKHVHKLRFAVCKVVKPTLTLFYHG